MQQHNVIVLLRLAVSPQLSCNKTNHEPRSRCRSSCSSSVTLLRTAAISPVHSRRLTAWALTPCSVTMLS